MIPFGRGQNDYSEVRRISEKALYEGYSETEFGRIRWAAAVWKGSESALLVLIYRASAVSELSSSQKFSLCSIITDKREIATRQCSPRPRELMAKDSNSSELPRSSPPSAWSQK